MDGSFYAIHAVFSVGIFVLERRALQYGFFRRLVWDEACYFVEEPLQLHPLDV